MTDHIVLMDSEAEDCEIEKAYIFKNTPDLDAVYDKIDAKKMDIDPDEAAVVLKVKDASDFEAVISFSEDFEVKIIE